MGLQFQGRMAVATSRNEKVVSSILTSGFTNSGTSLARLPR